MSKFKAIIFDMDGVITDSESLMETVFPELSAELGYTMTQKHIFDTLGTTLEFGKEYFAKEFGKDFPYELLCERFFRRLIDMAYQGEMKLKSGVIELLDYLKEHRYPIALASSNTKECVMSYMEAFQLNHYFSSILTGDDVEEGKPNPALFLDSAKNLNILPSECMVIEDSLNGLKAAKAAGMTSVFIPDLLPYCDDLAPFADYYFDTILDVIKLLDKEIQL